LPGLSTPCTAGAQEKESRHASKRGDRSNELSDGPTPQSPKMLKPFHNPPIGQVRRI
jgi:hypothetical protein